MIVRNCPPRMPIAVLATGMIVMAADPALARAEHALRCWKKLAPQTLVEIGHVQANADQYSKRQAQANSARRPAALLLSDGLQRTAFSAGLLVGWAETGHRPVFDLVTAVGPSAVIAPFAFAGTVGDQTIADAFNCKTGNWQSVVSLATARMNASVLARIRQGHLEGRRLMIAIKGSPARAETVWDIGKIAASQHPNALEQIKRIIAASVDLTSQVPVPGAPVKAGRAGKRNHTFRVVGAGLPLLFQPALGRRIKSWYVVHNSALFTDEVASYGGKRRSGAIKSFTSDDVYLRPVYDVLSHAGQTGGAFQIAVIRPRRYFFPATEFDQAFMREVFLRAYRFARMGRLWQSEPLRN